MMQRVIPILLALLVLLSPGLTLPALGQDIAPAAAPPGWASLGPIGPFPTTVVGVSPRWPADPFILAATRLDLARSSDGGSTWERLPTPLASSGAPPAGTGPTTIEPTQLVSRLGPGNTEIWFLLGNAFASGSYSLFRSDDRGQTWAEVLIVPTFVARLALEFSPTFSMDGAVFFVGGGRAYRSRDAGASWLGLDPQPDEQVHQLVVSPAFGTDRTVFARVVPPNSVRGDRTGLVYSATANEASAGIVVSVDGGDSWAPASIGLQIGDIPFRHVQELVISPTFAQDRALLALAWGPPGSPESRYTTETYVPLALFGSDDGGATWEARAELLWPEQFARPVLGSMNVRSGVLTMSPAFSTTGQVLLGLYGHSGTGSPDGCAILRSTDRGRNWRVTAPPTRNSWERCRPAAFHQWGDSEIAWMHRPRETDSGWWQSLDAGQTWAAVETPDQAGLNDGQWTVAPDGTLLVAGDSGIWALGPSARQTGGSLPCAIEVGPTFRAVWDALSPKGRVGFGCPASPEQVTLIEERMSRNSQSAPETTREYRTQDGAPWRIEAFGTPSYTRLIWRRTRDDYVRVEAQEPRVVPGTVQWTDRGGFLRLERWDGKIVTIIASGIVQDEWEDGQPSLGKGR